MPVSKAKLEKDIMIKQLEKTLDVDFSGWVYRWDLYKEGDGHGYEPCYEIKDILQEIEVTNKDSVVDIGCGKGYAMFLLSAYDFKRVSGVEKDKRLFSIAKTNVTKLWGTSNEKGRFEIYNCDASIWNFYNEYNYFFLNNPFGEDTCRKVAGKIIESANNNMSEKRVIYQTPEFKNIFLEYGFKEIFNCGDNVILSYKK